MPPASPFVDHVRLYLKSGKGGNGIVHWRKEKFVPKGGPDGGDGGRGGHIILRGDAQMWTLLDLKYRKHIHADDGQTGQGALKTGKDAKDIVLRVPLGTVAHDAETGETLGEITENGQELVVAKGGHGGKGNWHFRSPTNQTPTYASPGGNAEERLVELELKVLADVGLVGFPNAGKSTLLSVLTAAKPKIADYPFTTLVPNLGIVKHRDFQSFVIADIPGIIEGASEGRGLGIQFLRHIERNSILLLMVSVDSEKPMKEYNTLMKELEAYNPELMQKERLLALTKTDLKTEKEVEKIRKQFEKKLGAERIVTISSVTQSGLQTLRDKLWEMLNPPAEKEDWM
jgi:GTP-binding protein